MIFGSGSWVGKVKAQPLGDLCICVVVCPFNLNNNIFFHIFINLNIILFDRGTQVLAKDYNQKEKEHLMRLWNVVFITLHPKKWNLLPFPTFHFPPSTLFHWYWLPTWVKVIWISLNRTDTIYLFLDFLNWLKSDMHIHSSS